MSADLPPVGPPPPPPGGPPPPDGSPPGAVNPYGSGPPSRYHWAAILAGLLLGFFGWVAFSVLVIIGTYYGQGTNPTADAIVPWLFLAILVAAVALIIWPRSRPFGKGLVLGIAIGVIVAGGLCVPIIWSA